MAMIVELILIFMVLEGIVLALLWRRTGRGVPVPLLVANLAAGACLLLALRGALVGDSWTVVAFWLVGALLGHLVDLRERWVG